MPVSENGFSFDWLYQNYLPQLIASNSSFVIHPYQNASAIALTYDGCVAGVGSKASWYTRHDVYDRVLLWRVPLIALWATTTLPAFGWHTKLFTLMHLIADPIDTFWSLFYKLHLAQLNARWVRETDEDPDLFTTITPVYESENVDDTQIGIPLGRRQTTVGDQESREEKLAAMLRRRDPDILQHYRDVVALIITAYDEWGCGIAASKAMNYAFHEDRWTEDELAVLRDRCASAAFYVASDRVSRFLPSIVSTLSFLIQIFAGFWKTLNALGPDPSSSSTDVTLGLNRTPHNIAFGALFFWLPLAVMLTAFVGGSQTSHLVPRVLQKFRKDIEESRPRRPDRLPAVEGYEKEKFPDLSHITDKRWSRGGLPVWQIDKFREGFFRNIGDINTQNRKGKHSTPEKKNSVEIVRLLASISIVLIPTMSAMSVSWITPTTGFGCRALTQLSFLLIWLLSALLDWLLFKFFPDSERPTIRDRSPKLRRSWLKDMKKGWSRTRLYWLVFIKDFVFMAGSICLLTSTALGIFNSCECWSKWNPSHSARYISFPQEPYIFHLIKGQLGSTYPIIVLAALLSQIIIIMGIVFYFREGHRVLKQRDLDDVLEGPGFFTEQWRKMTEWKRRPQQINSFDHSSVFTRLAQSPE